MARRGCRAGGDWDAIGRQGKLRYRDARGELDLPLPRLLGRHQAMNAALAVAMLRHQDALHVAASALSAAMGWADWPARLQHSRPRPARPANREVWLDGGHNPSAARQVADFVAHRFDDGKPLHIVFAQPRDQGPARRCSSRSRAWSHACTRVPIPDHASFAPSELVDIAGGSASPRSAHDSVEQALAAVPADARVLIFGSLYLAGEVLAANDQLPD